MFKVGDKVVVKDNIWTNSVKANGKVGEVVEIDGGSVLVHLEDWHNGHDACLAKNYKPKEEDKSHYYVSEDDIELLENIEEETDEEVDVTPILHAIYKLSKTQLLALKMTLDLYVSMIWRD